MNTSKTARRRSRMTSSSDSSRFQLFVSAPTRSPRARMRRIASSICDRGTLASAT
jgi:hypothetical protein